MDEDELPNLLLEGSRSLVGLKRLLLPELKLDVKDKAAAGAGHLRLSAT